MNKITCETKWQRTVVSDFADRCAAPGWDRIKLIASALPHCAAAHTKFALHRLRAMKDSRSTAIIVAIHSIMLLNSCAAFKPPTSIAMQASAAGPRLQPPVAQLKVGVTAVMTALLPAVAHATDELAVATTAIEITPRGITPEDTIVFILGCVPFLWATIEFWRRIAVGESFGTGKDSVIINDTSGNRKKPLQRVLGQDAITAAYILFALAGASAILVVIATVDVLQ